MPAVARANGIDKVFSLTGTARGCRAPINTTTGIATETSVVVGPEGYPVVVEGDKVELHPAAGCSPDESELSTFSSTVFVGGKRVGRVGDLYTADNIITSGAPTVFIGG
jgi:uncharacterized Zn-binding protein involved in type VI secretion